MSEPEGFDAKGFLARWSRRKLEAPEAAPDAGAEPSADSGAEAAGTSAGGTPAAPPAGATAPAVDLSKLPTLESITAGSDIRAFLSAGVPEQLKRAALRRAWTADPAIRDFVGLAENAWDFTAPDSMPGFGPMLPGDDIARMVAQIFGKEEPAAPAAEADSASTPSDSAHEIGASPAEEGTEPSARQAGGADEPRPLVVAAEGGSDSQDQDDTPDIAQNEPAPEPASAGRAHGGAVPR